MAEYITYSQEETIALGYRLGCQLPANSIICFFGDLGAGKTTFIKGLTAAVVHDEHVQINSPTFVYLNVYPSRSQGEKAVYHFDLYRLRDADEFLSMGFDELFYAEGVCCIEWSERIAPILPSNCIYVEMIHKAETVRHISIKSCTALYT